MLIGSPRGNNTKIKIFQTRKFGAPVDEKPIQEMKKIIRDPKYNVDDRKSRDSIFFFC